jgi:hypothetical protein
MILSSHTPSVRAPTVGAHCGDDVASPKTAAPTAEESAFPKSDWPLRWSRFPPGAFHQAVLQSLEKPFDAPFGLRTLCGDPFNAQLVQSSSKLPVRSLFLQLFSPIGPARRTKDAVFIGVMGHRSSVAFQPPAQGSQVLFGGVLGGKPSPELAGRVIDQKIDSGGPQGGFFN